MVLSARGAAVARYAPTWEWGTTSRPCQLQGLLLPVPGGLAEGCHCHATSLVAEAACVCDCVSRQEARPFQR